jgi:hypothetical protein
VHRNISHTCISSAVLDPVMGGDDGSPLPLPHHCYTVPVPELRLRKQISDFFLAFAAILLITLARSSNTASENAGRPLSLCLHDTKVSRRSQA